MPGQATRLGPFAGGLNSLSDPTAVADTELVDCVNFELDLDGSLTSRPPITLASAATPGTSRINLLTYYSEPTGTYYLIGSSNTGTYYFNGASWTLITNTINAAAATQFRDRLFLVPPIGAINPGGTWSPSAGFVADADMPQGNAIIPFKNRLFISPGKGALTNGSRLHFSNIVPVTGDVDWNVSVNFLDIQAGDGQNLIDVQILNNSIMCFKNDSTYVYNYDSAPDKGSVNNISATIGVSDIHCIVAFENTLMIYHEGNVYELINYNYTRLNIKCPFGVDNNVPMTFDQPVAMSLFNDRLIVRHFDRVYVFNLRTRTWGRWHSERYFAYFLAEPKNSVITDIPTCFAGSAILNTTQLYRIADTFDAISTEEMTCTFRTKNYDYQISSNFKKLYWWGADVVAQGDVNVVALPIVYSTSLSWDQLELGTWDDLQTWDQPLTAIPIVADAVNTAGAGNRKFLRFNKTLRFRQIYFTVSITNDGTSGTAPCKVFNLTTYVGTRQMVSKEIS